MTEKVLDQDPEEFRAAAHAAVDWIADYLRDIRKYPVLSRAVPGEINAKFADSASETGKPLTDLLDEFRERIVPGITHWNHPGFFAYFSITGSRAGILGELLTAALNANGMIWKTSPAVTELETKTLSWLRQAVDLPDDFFGIINDTASVNTFLALAAARERSGQNVRAEGLSGRTVPLMRIYCSDQTHSSIEKAALALGLGAKSVVKVPSDALFRMDVDALKLAIASDKAAGFLPIAVVATTGTTSTASIDPVPAIALVAQRESLWLHVDAAYGGSAAVHPDFRYLLDGAAAADSIVINPHKWLFVPIDCSVLYTRHPDALKETFSLVPEYLKTAELDAINYMDYGIQLGRRFRALKLWFVLEHYGLASIRENIAQHCHFAARLASELESRADIELLAPQSLSVVVFRRVVRSAAGVIDHDLSEKASIELLERMNASGRIYLSATRLRGTYALRVAIGNAETRWSDVQQILDAL